MLRKFAVGSVIGEPQIARAGTGLMKNAHRARFDYEPREGFLYVRSRMISSRCNDNYDEFPAEEIAKGYQTFKGKPVFVNHHNENHRRMRGVIIDAALHEDRNPDGSPDTWTEGLHEIDAVRFPKLARAILKQEIQRTSMGVDVAHSFCSACGNKASTPTQYCRHIPGQKGAKLWRADASTGRKRGTLIREICHGLGFFENSLLVEDPADPTAYFLGDVEMGPGLDHLTRHATLLAPGAQNANPVRPTITVQAPATRKTASRQEHSLMIGSLRLVQGARCVGCAGLNTVASHDGHHECFDCEAAWHPHTASQTVEAGGGRGRTRATRPLKPLIPRVHPDKMPPDEKSEWNAAVRAHGTEFAKRNPMRAENVVEHWNQALPHEKENGKNWYPDAHHASAELAESISHRTGRHVPLHQMAGLIANYSPQTHWATNIVTAAKAAREGRALGGKGNKDFIPDQTGKERGILASDSQKDRAQRMLDGEHYKDVLTGPKTRAFGHLIEHGGDSPEDLAKGEHQVCVDRHAYSVACGARASDIAYGQSGLGGKQRYQQATDVYKDAAKRISKKEGEDIHPHQVQATTWLVRQRLNEHEDNDAKTRGRVASNAQAAIADMTQYMGEHHPDASVQMPGTGYSQREPGDDGRSPLEKIAFGGATPAPKGGRPLRGARFPGR